MGQALFLVAIIKPTYQNASKYLQIPEHLAPDDIAESVMQFK